MSFPLKSNQPNMTCIFQGNHLFYEIHKDTTHRDEKHSKLLKMAVLVVVVCTYLVVLYSCILPHSHTARNKILSFCQATKATAPSNQERKSWIERRFKTPKKVHQWIEEIHPSCPKFTLLIGKWEIRRIISPSLEISETILCFCCCSKVDVGKADDVNQVAEWWRKVSKAADLYQSLMFGQRRVAFHFGEPSL